MKRGFTIVELLIVIVVIAILAAITIVAYTGIQSRANDAAVQADLAAAAKALELYRADKGSYPQTTTELDAMSATASLTVSKGSYTAGATYNYPYCADTSKYAIAGQSKSGTAYYVSSISSSPKVFSSWGTSVTTICPALGIASGLWVWGYRGDTQAWQSWIK